MSLLGSSAPDIDLFSDQYKKFRLSDHSEQNVLLLFFPAAFSGVCTTELNAVNNDLASYADTLIVGISTDSPMALAEFKKVHGLRFDLVSDHDATVSKAYGAKYDHNFTAMELDRIARRSAFIVDKSGKIVYEEVLESAGDMPDLDSIKAKLNELS